MFSVLVLSPPHSVVTAHLNASVWISGLSFTGDFFSLYTHGVHFIRRNHMVMGAVWSCGSLTFPGQVWTLPFILVSTPAQLCKGYLAKCYRRQKWQVCASRCSDLLLHTKSAKDITVCWWCSKEEYICYLICLSDFTEPFHLPILSEAQKKTTKMTKNKIL